MFPNLTRDQVQLISFALFSTGAAILILGGWHSEMWRSVGISSMAGSIWFIMMQESILLTKVQNEMHTVLEKLSMRRENEIEELLYFLRDAKLRRAPWDSIEAASEYIQEIPFPAYVIDSGLRVSKINKSWSEVLGWDESIYGKSAIPLQCPEHWGELSIKITSAGDIGEQMHFSKYCYLSSSGQEIPGTVAIFIFPDQSGCAAIFYPDHMGIIKRKKIALESAISDIEAE